MEIYKRINVQKKKVVKKKRWKHKVENLKREKNM